MNHYQQGLPRRGGGVAEGIRNAPSYRKQMVGRDLRRDSTYSAYSNKGPYQRRTNTTDDRIRGNRVHLDDLSYRQRDPNRSSIWS